MKIILLYVIGRLKRITVYDVKYFKVSIIGATKRALEKIDVTGV